VYLNFLKFVLSDEPLMNLYHFFAFVFLNDRTENAFPLFMIMLSANLAVLSCPTIGHRVKSLQSRTESYMAKKSKRRAWTKEDIRVLKTLARQKTPASKIARTLKRTEGATRQRASSMGVSLETRG